jgi:beta-N-acetylhexosaminidase
VTAIGEWSRGVVAAGFDGERLDPDLPLTGGYVLFSRNATSPAQMRSLTDALRARAGDDAPPLIAIDQEGGRVARLRQDVERMPSMMALGATGDVDLAGRAGEQTAFDLRRAGCTLDFAPVIDLALYPDNTVIGTRSIGADPVKVAALGKAFADGLERGGIVPCFKHFPGHGATPVDSHVALPVVDADAATLRRRDVLPFAAVAARAPAMMSAHAIFRAFDRWRPATMSTNLAVDLLRSELGFNGVLITDCLEMSAVAQSGETPRNAVAALSAGADLLLVSHSAGLAACVGSAIERAVSEGELSAQRLHEAYSRVMRLRRSVRPPIALDAYPPHPGVGREIARRAITLIRGMPHADPVASIVVSFETNLTDGINISAFKSASLRHEAPALEEIELPLEPSEPQLDRALDALSVSGRRPVLLARRAHLYDKQAHAIARLIEQYPDAVVVSTLEPFDLPLFANARHVLAAYGDDVASIGGLADVLFGGSPPAGRLPVEIIF